MKIGLQFAMPAELNALPGFAGTEPFETVSGVDFYQVAPDILACAGGISKVNAAMTAEILCLKYGVDLILNAGVAGCLTDLATGSLVVASEFLQHDVDTSVIGDPVGLVSTVNRIAFPTWEPEHCAATAGAAGLFRGDRAGGHRRLVCHRRRPGGLHPGYVPAPAGGDGGLRHRAGVPAQRCALRGGEVRFGSPLCRQSG